VKSIWAFIVVSLFCFSAEAASGTEIKVLRVGDNKIITFSQMISDIKNVDFIFIGEVHDVIEHHDLELAVMRALHESDAPIAVGLEMFRADSQQVLNSWVRGSLPLDRFLPVYYDNWHEPWPLYSAIFQYARDHEIPLVGLNIPDRIAEKVARKGFASMTETERRQLPPSVTCNVDPTYMEFIRKAYAGHSLQGRAFVNFCEAQLVWDKSMAWHLLTYFNKHRHRPVLVLAGVGHAWRRGIPDQVADYSKFTSRVVLPLVPDQIERETVTTDDADYVLLDWDPLSGRSPHELPLP
jgi:uncharacterized iron-regulated protein